MLMCTHHADCMYRYKHKGKTRRFCLACIVEQYPDCDIDSKDYRKKHTIVTKTTSQPIPVKKKMTEEPDCGWTAPID